MRRITARAPRRCVHARASGGGRSRRLSGRRGARQRVREARETRQRGVGMRCIRGAFYLMVGGWERAEARTVAWVRFLTFDRVTPFVELIGVNGCGCPAFLCYDAPLLGMGRRTCTVPAYACCERFFPETGGRAYDPSRRLASSGHSWVLMSGCLRVRMACVGIKGGKYRRTVCREVSFTILSHEYQLF